MNLKRRFIMKVITLITMCVLFAVTGWADVAESEPDIKVMLEKIQSTDWKIRSRAVYDVFYPNGGERKQYFPDKVSVNEDTSMQLILLLEREKPAFYEFKYEVIKEWRKALDENEYEESTKYKLFEKYDLYYKSLSLIVASLKDSRAVEALLNSPSSGNIVQLGDIAIAPLVKCIEECQEQKKYSAVSVLSSWVYAPLVEDVGQDYIIPEMYYIKDDISLLKARQALIKASCDTDDKVRRASIYGLQAFDTTDVIQALEEIAASDEYRINEYNSNKQKALKALEEIKKRKALSEDTHSSKSAEGAQAGSLGRKPQEHAGQQETKP